MAADNISYVTGYTSGNNDEFPVFVNGVMQGNLTSIQGQAPTSNTLNEPFNLPDATIAPQINQSTNPTERLYVSPNATISAGTTTQPIPTSPSTWKLPSLKDVVTGMTKGPGTADSIGGFNLEQMFQTALIFLLGLAFVIGGLFLFAKETGVNPRMLLNKK